MKKVLGLDVGSNSVGWALIEEQDGTASQIIDVGCRVFIKAVEDKNPTPKNQERRKMRLGRRVLQRRARRKQRMLNYLVSLNLLPKQLQGDAKPEIALNKIGDPYALRVKGLDEQLSPYELGRVLLHFVARRGFLSSKKQLAGDLVDDPDTIDYLRNLDSEPTADKEEGAFKVDIQGVYQEITKSGARTLGEYLYRLERGECKRNRKHAGGHLRTERAMYKDELAKIWKKQKSYFPHLPNDFMEDNKGVKWIIFYQRPLKLKKNRVGKCSLERKNYRANMARLAVQRFRYLLDVNHLKYKDPSSGEMMPLNSEQRTHLDAYLNCHPNITPARLRKELGLDKSIQINLEEKNIKGNTTACKIRSVLNAQWDEMAAEKQETLFEDLFTIKKKSALKKRLIEHWGFDIQTAIKLCLLEFEAGHLNHSLKAVNKLLPYLEQGKIDSDARQAAGYGHEADETDRKEKLLKPPPTANPIVNKGLHELKRVVNAVIKHYGKPDAIRIEMARDLEMNTKRYKDYLARVKKNKEDNEKADAFVTKATGVDSKKYERIKHRLWQEQGHRCIYSGKCISETQLLSSATEIDHIVPRSMCLDDSYTNKTLCLAAENRHKGQKTPFETWGHDKNRWHEINIQLEKIYKDLPSRKYRKDKTHPKKKQFLMREEDIKSKYQMSAAQLNDTRYIAREALAYVEQLGCDVSVTKGAIVAETRYQWGLNSLLGESDKKERADHRHHAVDAVVIACINRQFHAKVTHAVKRAENSGDKPCIEAPYRNFRADVSEKLKHVIVSHAPQRKLSGALHEDTGAGYIAKHGGLVYRKPLDSGFTRKQVNKIVDASVKEKVEAHLNDYGGDPKRAFSPDGLKKLRIGNNHIKRVRILQSKTTKERLQESKFGVKDKQGKIFKWMPYGNTHHVEIIRHKETGKITGEFVTMMEAHRRAMTGTKSAINRSVAKEDIINTGHGAKHEFLMALHINDTVSIKNADGERSYYRVQKLDKDAKGVKITLHTDAHKSTEIPKDKTFSKSISTLMSNEYELQKHSINAIGRRIE